MLLSPIFKQRTGALRGQKSQRAWLAEQSLETGSQSFLLFCKCSATESSYSSAPLLTISTSMYILPMLSLPREALLGVCVALCECCLHPPRQTTVGLTGCLTAQTAALPPLRCAPITAGLQLRPVTPTYSSLPAARDITAFFHQCPEAGSSPRVTDLSFFLFWFLRSVTS